MSPTATARPRPSRPERRSTPGPSPTCPGSTRCRGARAPRPTWCRAPPAVLAAHALGPCHSRRLRTDQSGPAAAAAELRGDMSGLPGRGNSSHPSSPSPGRPPAQRRPRKRSGIGRSGWCCEPRQAAQESACRGRGQALSGVTLSRAEPRGVLRRVSSFGGTHPPWKGPRQVRKEDLIPSVMTIHPTPLPGCNQGIGLDMEPEGAASAVRSFTGGVAPGSHRRRILMNILDLQSMSAGVRPASRLSTWSSGCNVSWSTWSAGCRK